MICWALVLSLPVMAPLAWWLAPPSFSGVTMPAWFSLAYVALFSMLIGFVFWYRGLAQGGIAAVGQLQLLHRGNATQGWFPYCYRRCQFGHPAVSPAVKVMINA